MLETCDEDSAPVEYFVRAYLSLFMNDKHGSRAAARVLLGEDEEDVLPRTLMVQLKREIAANGVLDRNFSAALDRRPIRDQQQSLDSLLDDDDDDSVLDSVPASTGKQFGHQRYGRGGARGGAGAGGSTARDHDQSRKHVSGQFKLGRRFCYQLGGVRSTRLHSVPLRAVNCQSNPVRARERRAPTYQELSARSGSRTHLGCNAVPTVPLPIAHDA